MYDEPLRRPGRAQPAPDPRSAARARAAGRRARRRPVGEPARGVQAPARAARGGRRGGARGRAAAGLPRAARAAAGDRRLARALPGDVDCEPRRARTPPGRDQRLKEQPMNGTLEQTAAAPRLRFTRRLAHAPEKVWRALTEPEHLKAWFPDTIVVDEWTVGAPLRFEHAPVPEGGFDGEALAVEPQRLLEFRWGTDVIRFELEPDADGTRLTLLDTIDELGKAARDAAGWHTCLDQLEHHLDGSAPPWSPSDRWKQVRPAYVDELGPEAAAIGPPEGALD